jgi:HD-GYP domain-containing protein (c-di-GMP phosphodiesterase class II)
VALAAISQSASGWRKTLVVEAMASHRPYRPALGIDAALAEIEKNREVLYDVNVADACLRLFREKGFQIEGT